KNPFDLSRPSLLRMHFHQLSDELLQFTLVDSHLIIDGWSLMMTLAEIFQHYAALCHEAAPPRTTPPAVSFRDYVFLERAVSESEENRNYWVEKLRNCPLPALPQWPARLRDAGGPRFQWVRFVIPAAVLAGLQRLADASRISLKSVFLAAHVKAM